MGANCITSLTKMTWVCLKNIFKYSYNRTNESTRRIYPLDNLYFRDWWWSICKTCILIIIIVKFCNADLFPKKTCVPNCKCLKGSHLHRVKEVSPKVIFQWCRPTPDAEWKSKMIKQLDTANYERYTSLRCSIFKLVLMKKIVAQMW